jgi:hypothetical protein
MLGANVTAPLFILSPARCGGERATLLATSENSELAVQLRNGGASVGEVFAWLSALYFRGKLTYARAFAAPGGVLVMAPGRGLIAPETRIAPADLRAMGAVEIESEAFVAPLRRDAEAVARRSDAPVVLLGSIASGKYADTLRAVFGARLLFPETFVGRGDMSRGGLLLRAARSGEQLAYIPIEGAILRGKRPPKLPRLRRQ